MTAWYIQEYEQWIEDGCPINTQITLLTLANNQLTSLPESFGNLSSLEYLDLENNQLTSLPESFGNLSSLQSLHLDNNQLTSLPLSMDKLPSLRFLYQKYPPYLK